MRLFRTPLILKALYPGLIWHIPTNEKKIYVTFDDGPVKGVTEFVLATLKEYNAAATFFCIGDNVRKDPLLFNRIISEGHKVGNHTCTHLKGWASSIIDYYVDVEKCQNLIGDSNLFRPPYGRIKRSQITALKKYSIVMWDVLTYDYAKISSKAKTLEGVKRATRPGSIVVFHDSVKADVNMRYMLPKFLKHFADLGYSFDSLPDGLTSSGS